MANTLHRRWRTVAALLAAPAPGQLASHGSATVGDAQVATPCPVCENHNQVLL